MRARCLAGRKPFGRIRLTLALIAGVTLPFVSLADSQPSGLGIEQRIAARRAIEEVYWRHRIWPRENPGPKPALSAVLPDAAIRTRVGDILRKSNALEKYWHRPIAPAQLQAEMNRMAEHTQNPRMLQELFAALGNDARLIAETLARETLADRMIRDWYARDDRFHGELKRQVAAAVAACPNVGCMRSLGGEYDETTWRLGRERRRDDVSLGAGEWRALHERLASTLDGVPDALPVHRMSGLEETPEAFVVTAVLSQGKDVIRTATVAWTKVSFDAWWQIERASVDDRIDDSAFPFSLPALDVAACVPDTWTPTNANVPPFRRYNATAVWTGTEMIIWGGQLGGGVVPSVGPGGRYNPSTDSWIPTSEVIAMPNRAGHTAVWTGTRMIVWGGVPSGSSPWTNTGGRYDPFNDTWEATSTGTNVPIGRSGHTAVWTGTQMIVWGGSGSPGAMNSGGRYDPSTDTWLPTSTGTSVPSLRSGHSAVWTGTQMIIWGGPSNSSGGRYSPSTDTWSPTSMETNVPSPRGSLTAIWTGTEMIVWGGIGTGNVYLNTGGRYTPSTNTWAPTSIGPNVPQARGGHIAVWTGSEMIVWGGIYFDGAFPQYLNTGGRYNPTTDTWTPTPSGVSAPVQRTYASAVWTGNQMIIWGGYNGLELSTGGRYDPSTDSWLPTSTGSGVPGKRTGNSTVWTGAEMIVWGGYVSVDAPFGPQNSGGRYDPATDTWQATSMVGAVPEARSGHSAVWSGTKMIVWGGSKSGQGYSSDFLNSGGRYDPSTDVWSSTSLGTSVPAPRVSHSAVWSGTTMIVWGGYALHCEFICNGDCCFDIFNSGGRYDPSTDTWAPTSTGANVPARRYDSPAVWTGTQMIIWGGRDYVNFNDLYLNNGGRYDPSTDSWMPTSTGANVPVPRYGHSVVWTGTRMIVWGGYHYDGGDQYLNDGGRYDPSTDTWTRISTGTNAPVARYNHAAVWTGTDMIIWGGYYSDSDFVDHYLDTGGQYYPSADSWTPTSTVHAPYPRYGPTGVWDGTEMIIWGGSVDQVGAVYTGGRYCPILTFPLQVVSVVPQNNALNVPVGTNVTVVFSEPVNPATVTPSTFRLVDPSSLTVAASVGLAPDGRTATLDPTPPGGALAFNTLYTVAVTSGVQDLAGQGAVPFASRFVTAAAPASGTPLSSVSDQSVLPAPPPGPGPGGASTATTPLAGTLGPNLGYSVSAAGDLNNDQLADFVGGAPGYSLSGLPEAGAVAIYLGSNAPEPPSGNHPREVADVIFTGEAAHDRAGSSVASGFDFDGDGVGDILIGAEQVNRTIDPPEVTGSGKVYLIYFKPQEYDFNSNGIPDYLERSEVFVPLSLVGTTISGAVLIGAGTGDQAGYAVAAGGLLESSDTRDDVVIGAPGAGGGDGRIYVLFSSSGVSGTKSLGNVGGTIPGVVYLGSAGERLGSSVALPGDVTAPTGPDIALGAPLADTTQVDAGRVYLATAGNLQTGTVNVASIPTQVHGDQACEELGFAVAGGGDNRASGSPQLPGGDPDLLIGAPYRDAIASPGDPCLDTTPAPNAGRVIQTTGRLPGSVIDAGQVGSAVEGVIWRGVQAGGALGWAVGRLGDLSGNNLDDIGLSAPFASPGLSGSGAVYVVEGSANTGMLGSIDADLVGQIVSGGIFLGTQTGEEAGLALCAAGDLDGDGLSGSTTADDFTVGSPGWDASLGTVHQVLGTLLQQPGECTALGCTVADLTTGAVLVVPPNAIAAGVKYRLAVSGLPASLLPTACGSHALAGLSLVGWSSNTRTDCAIPPCTPPGFAIGPNIGVPTRQEMEYQLTYGEPLALRYCDATLGWRTLASGPSTALVQNNTYLAGRKAAAAFGVDTLRQYGVLFDDADHDDVRDTCDCSPGSATLWAAPGEAGDVFLSGQGPSPTTLAWGPPACLGGSAVTLLYDTIRSSNKANFVIGAVCVEANGVDTTSTDAQNPPTGQAFYYIVSPENGCTAGTACSACVQRPARDC